MHSLLVLCCAKLLQSCLALHNPIGCSPPGSSVHGIFQAGILEWVAMTLPGDLPNPGIEPVPLMSPALAGGFFAMFFRVDICQCRQEGAAETAFFMSL